MLLFWSWEKFYYYFIAKQQRNSFLIIDILTVWYKVGSLLGRANWSKFVVLNNEKNRKFYREVWDLKTVDTRWIICSPFLSKASKYILGMFYVVIV